MIVYFREENGDYLAVDTDTRGYYLATLGRDEYEGRAVAIAGLVGSVCTTGISRAYLQRNCKRVGMTTVPAAWQQAIGFDNLPVAWPEGQQQHGGNAELWGPPMTEKKAKRQSRRMLESFTPGTILSLMSELFREDAEDAQRAGDDVAQGQCRNAEATLIVVGLGIDAIRPR